jgi:hypothetical protein
MLEALLANTIGRQKGERSGADTEHADFDHSKLFQDIPL